MKNVLFVEDDQILLGMYQKLFQNDGYSVDTVGDGEEALKKALEGHPDLILLDIRLPKMDGMTMLEKLRQDSWGAKARVIILTNLDATDEMLKKVVETHPTYYLVKANTKPEEVLEHVKEIFEEDQKGAQTNG